MYVSYYLHSAHQNYHIYINWYYSVFHFHKADTRVIHAALPYSPVQTVRTHTHTYTPGRISSPFRQTMRRQLGRSPSFIHRQFLAW